MINHPHSIHHQHVAAIGRGALAGLVATAPMTAVMALIHRHLPARQRPWRLPPEQITLALAERVSVDDNLSRTQEKVLTGLGHFGYGALCGAAYGPCAEQTKANPVISGLCFGLGVWAVSYLGWLPAARVRRNATQDLAGTNTMMITAHLAWGASTAIAYEAMRKEERTPRQEKHNEGVIKAHEQRVST